MIVFKVIAATSGYHCWKCGLVTAIDSLHACEIMQNRFPEFVHFFCVIRSQNHRCN